MCWASGDAASWSFYKHSAGRIMKEDKNNCGQSSLFLLDKVYDMLLACLLWLLMLRVS